MSAHFSRMCACPLCYTPICCLRSSSASWRACRLTSSASASGGRCTRSSCCLRGEWSIWAAHGLLLCPSQWHDTILSANCRWPCVLLYLCPLDCLACCSVLLDHLLAVWPHTPVPLDRHWPPVAACSLTTSWPSGPTPLSLWTATDCLACCSVLFDHLLAVWSHTPVPLDRHWLPVAACSLTTSWPSGPTPLSLWTATDCLLQRAPWPPPGRLAPHPCPSGPPLTAWPVAACSLTTSWPSGPTPLSLWTATDRLLQRAPWPPPGRLAPHPVPLDRHWLPVAACSLTTSWPSGPTPLSLWTATDCLACCSVLLDHLLAVWPHTPVPLDRHWLPGLLQHAPWPPPGRLAPHPCLSGPPLTACCSVLLDHLLAVWPHTPVPLDRHWLPVAACSLTTSWPSGPTPLSLWTATDCLLQRAPWPPPGRLAPHPCPSGPPSSAWDAAGVQHHGRRDSVRDSVHCTQQRRDPKCKGQRPLRPVSHPYSHLFIKYGEPIYLITWLVIIIATDGKL